LTALLTLIQAVAASLAALLSLEQARNVVDAAALAVRVVIQGKKRKRVGDKTVGGKKPRPNALGVDPLVVDNNAINIEKEKTPSKSESDHSKSDEGDKGDAGGDRGDNRGDA
jgi:hypothetical protein